jgi:hypothetical protein
MEDTVTRTDVEIRSCAECDFVYCGSIYCPSCQEPTGEPIPDEFLLFVLKETPCIFG